MNSQNIEFIWCLMPNTKYKIFSIKEFILAFHETIIKNKLIVYGC